MNPTSLQAYENIKPRIPKDHLAILSVLSYNKDMTYHEIAKALNWGNPNKAGRRMSELLLKELVKSGEIRKCSIAGTNCNTYLLNDRSRRN